MRRKEELFECPRCRHEVRGAEFHGLRKRYQNHTRNYDTLGGKYLCPRCTDFTPMKRVKKYF